MDELSLNITNACPNACTFCIRDRDAGWHNSNLYFSQDLTPQELIAAYDGEVPKIAQAGIKLRAVKLAGYGEPILRFDDLQPVTRHIRKNSSKDLIIAITTTGWPFFRHVSEDSSRIAELKKSGVSDVYLSLNAIDQENYDKIVKPGAGETDPRAFEDSLRFGRLAKEAGLEVTLGFIRLGGFDESAAKKFAQERGFSFKIRDYEA